MTGTIESVRRRNTLGPRKRSVRPILEGLEDRMLLYATSGGSWTFPSRITFSFAPDGTSVGGVSSNLFATLNAVAPTATWQAAFEKAAALWSAYANINLALVPDNGAPIGATGNQQDDPNFGDIRFAMIPQQSGTLAYAFLPPPFNGGSDAGDIVFNSNIAWQVNNNYDVETVAFHEIGHALGLEHSSTSSALMYAYYNGIKQLPTADDISGIQSIYGAYPAATNTNTSFTTATNITSLIGANGQIAISGLSLAGPTNTEWYYVTVPTTDVYGTFTVSMQSTNLSTLSPKLGIWNSAKVSVASGGLANVYGGTETITLTGVSPGQSFYIRASVASSPGGNGAYGLLVNFGNAVQAPIAPPNTVVLSQADQGGGSLGDSLPVTVGQMKDALNHLSTSPFQSVTTIVTDGLALMNDLASHDATASDPYQHLSGTMSSLVKGDVPGFVTHLNEFFADVIQTGSLAGYGDYLTVGNLKAAAAQYGHGQSSQHVVVDQPVIPSGSTATVVVNLHGSQHGTSKKAHLVITPPAATNTLTLETARGA